MLNNMKIPFENLCKFDLCNGGKMNLLTDVSKETADTLFEALSEEGYAVYDAHEERGNRFATFTKEGKAVHLSFFAQGGVVRLFCEEPKALPPVKAEGRAAVVAPLVTQIRATNFTVDCGMNYLIRLADGRFIVIDGGYGEYDESEHMRELLLSQNVLEKPVVALWFFSHPHGDHILGFLDYCKKYESEFVLERVCYNWSEPALTPYPCKHDHFDAYVESISDKTEVIIGHSGQRFVFDGCTLDVLYACEDAYPAAIRDFNDSSMVLRMTLNGHSVLWLGDASAQASKVMCRAYAKESLHCEVLQVGHHGFGGGSDELYRTVEPQLLLWPCPDFWFPVVREWGANAYLIGTPHLVENTFVAGQAETIWDFSEEQLRLAYLEDFRKGNLLYNADFAKKSLTALKWSCLTGGRTGFSPLSLDFIEGGCHLVCRPAATSVCCLVQSYDLKGAQSYVLRLRGKQTAGETPVGLIWNDATPTVWKDESVVPLCTAEDGSIDCRLTVDAEKQIATLECGAQTTVLPYTEVHTNGLHLVMRNGAEAELYEVSVCLP